MNPKLLNLLKIFALLLMIGILANSCSEDLLNDTGNDDDKELNVDNLIGTWNLTAASYNGDNVLSEYSSLFGNIVLSANGNCSINNSDDIWSLNVNSKSMVVGEFIFTNIDFDGSSFTCTYIDNEGTENKSISLTFQS